MYIGVLMLARQVPLSTEPLLLLNHLLILVFKLALVNDKSHSLNISCASNADNGVAVRSDVGFAWLLRLCERAQEAPRNGNSGL